MKLSNVTQRSPEWYALKKGKIGGTRFGQLISNRENRLEYELIDEALSDFLFPDDHISDEMQFGIDNEPIARELYSKQTGIDFQEFGAILSDYSDIHMASPDGVAGDEVLEIKCTENGAIHIQRFFNGPEKSMIPQIINYFAVSDEVKRVHWISYCPNRPERPIVRFLFERSSVIGEDRKGNPVTILDEAIRGRELIKNMEVQIILKLDKFRF